MTLKEAIKNLHVGRFYINFSFLNKNPEIVRSVLQHFLVIRAEAQYWNQCIEYTAYSELFKLETDHVYRIVVKLTPMLEFDGFYLNDKIVCEKNELILSQSY